jgi:heavy metal translocating P-type ATPase
MRRYPIIAVTVLVGLAGGVLEVAGQSFATQWAISAYALAIAAMQAWHMVKDLIHGRWGIDILAIMAIVATVVVGEYWASLVIVLMLSGGEALEDFAAGRAKRELSSLLARAPQVAHRFTVSTSDAEDIPVTEVAVGDTLLVRPSEIVPVDGELLSERATFDESSLTGESMPVERRAGGAVMSGSLNGERAVTVRATALSVDSQYQRIVALVADAAQSRAPIVRLADRYAVPFTAVSLLIAGLAWLLSGDPVRFAEVLVVATPCPLLIAAPVAFMGGMSRAARHGIIIKGGGTLEQLASAKTVAFDKTGTLTLGTPTLVAIHAAGPVGEDELLAVAASAEQYSSHVLARSIIDAAHSRGLVRQVAASARETATNGVVATIAGREVIVGKRAFVAEHAEGVIATPLANGQTAVYISIDGVFAGSVVLSDQLRDNAKRTLAGLASLGITRTLMLTGDGVQTAEHIAAEVGLTDVRADLLPIDKVAAIRSVIERPVVMVGDGVNDAPVLAAADVGIAMGAKGSTAASESADVVILLDDLSKTVDAVIIGKRTVRVALQSIWLGIGLSVGLMLLGTVGFLPAIVGAALQEVVDLATILNALRALSGGPRKRESGTDRLDLVLAGDGSESAYRLATVRNPALPIDESGVFEDRAELR